MSKVLGSSDFRNPHAVNAERLTRINSCYGDLKKADPAEGPADNTGPQDDMKGLFDLKNITKDSSDFAHHRLMAAYHSLKADELSNEALSLHSSEDPALHEKAKGYEEESERHRNVADEHRTKARAAHDEKKHGPWNETIPTKAQALKYGAKKSKEVDSSQESEDMVKKGDIAYKLKNSYSGQAPMTFDKTGKELKALAETKMVMLTEKQGTAKAKLEVIKGELTKAKITFRDPMEGDHGVQDIVWPTDSQMNDDLRRQCYDYSDLCYRIRDLHCDMKVLRLFVDNVDEEKTYSVSIDQLSALEKAMKSELDNARTGTLSLSKNAADYHEDFTEKGGHGSGRKKEDLEEEIDRIKDHIQKLKNGGTKDTASEMKAAKTKLAVKEAALAKLKDIKKSEAFDILGISKPD